MREKLTRNLGLKVLAFLIASFTWLLVVNTDDPETDKTYTNIPVKVVNTEVITNNNSTYQILDGTSEVDVTVTAKRSELSKIDAEDIVATADFKELTLGTQIPISVSIKGENGRDAKAIASPRNLQVKIDAETKNNFPITATSVGTPRDGYIIGDLSANPEKITISGPKTVIDSINKVMAEVNVSGLSENATLEAGLVLYDVNNNVIDQAQLSNNLGEDGLTVDVELYQIKSIPINLDTSGITAAEGYKIGEIKAEPKEVQVTGDEKKIKDLTAIDIPASALSATDLTERTERVIDISDYLPEGVQLVDDTTDSIVVSITIEQPGARTFEVPTNAIMVKNLADDLDMSYKDAVDVVIQIRGPSEVLDVYSIAKKVSIDLKDYKDPGTYTVPVDVELPEGCTRVDEASISIVLESKKKE